MTKSIRDVLKNKGVSIVSVSANETVYKVLELMAREDIGALLVMNEGKVVGIMSERDYARKVILKAGHHSKHLLRRS
jgi:CBS domain-containing protein